MASFLFCGRSRSHKTLFSGSWMAASFLLGPVEDTGWKRDIQNSSLLPWSPRAGFVSLRNRVALAFGIIFSKDYNGTFAFFPLSQPYWCRRLSLFSISLSQHHCGYLSIFLNFPHHHYLLGDVREGFLSTSLVYFLNVDSIYCISFQIAGNRFDCQNTNQSNASTIIVNNVIGGRKHGLWKLCLAFMKLCLPSPVSQKGGMVIYICNPSS